MGHTYTSLAFAVVLGLSASARAEDNAPVVHVDASSDIMLERVGDDGVARPTCRAPCGRPLDATSRYQLTGDGIRTSNRFLLPRAEEATIRIKPTSSSAFALGIVLVTISGVLATGGLFFLGGMVAMGDGFGAIPMGFGAILCGTGSLAVGIPGILMLSGNIQSRATVSEGDRVATAHTLSSSPLPLLTKSF